MTTTIQPVRAVAHPPKRKELVARLEANWRSTWAAMAGAAPGAVMKPIHRGLLVKTRLPIAWFNMALVDDRVRRPERAIAAAESYFSGLPFAVVFSEGHVDLALACENAGLRRDDTIPGMALSPLPHSSVDSALTIEPVTYEMLPTFLDVFCMCFGLPHEMAARLITPDYLDVEGLHDVVAFVDGRPVACATVYESMGVAGVYNVGTLPDRRGNGYGEAVTWAVIERAKKRGCHTAVLQSSDMGFGVYRRMGFEVVNRYWCYTNEPG